ncbi:hypothetical protein [Chryseolinea sp. H1M3-3]|jgi:hypothetical protein|uniref:hypothetical protein n=1 Tax=Chryseolinea sp. H1M3-3 TaxID=3034144 RepID=UPI0023ECB825|nr:hypothetical protein [Chryseolinea sp. H1M3-3]
MKYLLMVSVWVGTCLLAVAQDDPSVVTSDPTTLESSVLESDQLYVRSYKKIAKIITKEEFEKINTESIQYISVIKDPSSLYIYGDKGKNGVVLIVMKDDSGRLSGKKRRHK